MSVLRGGFVMMIGRMHQSDSMTKQIGVMVKELALAQELLRPQLNGKGTLYEHDCDQSGPIQLRCTRHG